MMGGVPVTKAGTVIIEKLRAAKTMEAGDLGGLMSGGMMGGLKSLLQNPMGQKGGNAKNQAQSASDKLDREGIGFLTQGALDNDLIPAIDAALDASAELVGVGDDPEGLINTIAASQTLSTVGLHDVHYADTTLLKPANMGAEYDALIAQMWIIVDNVFYGRMSDQDGRDVIQAQAAAVREIVQGSSDAKAAADAYAVYLASVAAAGAMLASGSPAWQQVMQNTFKPEILPIVQQANADLIDPNHPYLTVSEDPAEVFL